MQTDNTTAVQTAIDLACLFANPLLNSGQEKLGHLAIDVSLTVFSRMVLTDEVDGALKIDALKSYLSSSNSLQNYQQDFYNFLAADKFDNLKTLCIEQMGQWDEMEKSFPLIASHWAQSTIGWGARLPKDVVSTHNGAQKQALYNLLENPPADFYEMFFYGKAVNAVAAANKIVETAQRMNQELLKDIDAHTFLSVAEVQAKIQARRNEINTGAKRSIHPPPGPE